MVEAWAILAALGLIGVCLVVMTVTGLALALDLRRTLRGVDRMVSRLDRAAKETRHVLTGARRIVARTDRTAQHVERVIQRACATAEDTMERLRGFKEHAGTFVSRWFGNGAGSEPRPRFRR